MEINVTETIIIKLDLEKIKNIKFILKKEICQKEEITQICGSDIEKVVI